MEENKIVSWLLAPPPPPKKKKKKINQTNKPINEWMNKERKKKVKEEGKKERQIIRIE